MFCVICCGDRRDSCVFDGQRNDSFWQTVTKQKTKAKWGFSHHQTIKNKVSENCSYFGELQIALCHIMDVVNLWRVEFENKIKSFTLKRFTGTKKSWFFGRTSDRSLHSAAQYEKTSHLDTSWSVSFIGKCIKQKNTMYLSASRWESVFGIDVDASFGCFSFVESRIVCFKICGLCE
jgi:hypothetical protein